MTGSAISIGVDGNKSHAISHPGDPVSQPRVSPLRRSSLLHHDAKTHLHQEVHLHQEAHLPPEAQLLHHEARTQLHHEAKAKNTLRVSEKTWESRRIKEEMQEILSPNPLELHKVTNVPTMQGSPSLFLESCLPVGFYSNPNQAHLILIISWLMI